ASTEQSFNNKVAELEGTFEKRVSGVQGQVDQLKRQFEVVGRPFTPAQFKEYVSQLSFSSWKPQFLVLHNTTTPTLPEWHRVPGEVRIERLANFYVNQHWSGAPHLVIDDEVIWVVNPLTKPGIHSPSWNGVSIGIEMVGDYDTEPFDNKVRDNTIAAVVVLN